MTYQPASFAHTVDRATGYLIYDDPKVQTTYLNLRIFSDAIHDIQTNANIDLLYVQNNVQVSAVKDQTVQTICMFACKIFEGASIFFTPATAPAIVSMILGRVASGVITAVTKESDAHSDIQKKANEVRSGMNAMMNALKDEIDSMITDMEGYWNKVYHCDGSLDPSLRGDITIAELADVDGLMPDHNSKDYNKFVRFMGKRVETIITQQLLPAKWSIKYWDTMELKEYYLRGDGTVKCYDFDYQQYNPHTDEDFWAQKIPSNPASSGSYYIIASGESAKNFASWVKSMALDPSNTYNRKWYSSYGNWVEPTQHFDDRGNRWYVGKIHQALLVDSNGDFAPSSLSDWLFIDRVDDEANPDGIATREEVYRDWGLSGH